MKRFHSLCCRAIFACLLLGVLAALPFTVSAKKKTVDKAVISEAYARQDGSIRLVLAGKEKGDRYIIYRATKKDGKYKEVKRTKKSKFIDKDVKVYKELKLPIA